MGTCKDPAKELERRRKLREAALRQESSRRPKSEEHKKKIAKSNRGKHTEKWDEERKKRWIQVRTGMKPSRRSTSGASAAYAEWRHLVLLRDRHRCRSCGGTTNLEVHHLKLQEVFPELRLELFNGITLCHRCHRKEHGQLPYKLWYSIKKALRLLSSLDPDDPTIAKVLVILSNPENQLALLTNFNEENI